MKSTSRPRSCDSARSIASGGSRSHPLSTRAATPQSSQQYSRAVRTWSGSQRSSSGGRRLSAARALRLLSSQRSRTSSMGIMVARRRLLRRLLGRLLGRVAGCADASARHSLTLLRLSSSDMGSPMAVRGRRSLSGCVFWEEPPPQHS